MRTPYEEGTIQDLIIKWHYERSVKPEIEQELIDATTLIFEQVYSGCYALIIYDKDKNTLLKFKNKKIENVVQQYKEFYQHLCSKASK